MKGERRYSKPAGTVICDFECERRKPCPAPYEFRCKQEWLKMQAEKEEAKALVIEVD